MNRYIVLLAMFFLITLAISAQFDTMYFMKDGVVIKKQSIKEFEVDSVTFYAPITTLTLNLNIFPRNGGVVSGGGIYETGEKVAITATSKGSFVFVGWTGDTEYVADPYASNTTLIMPEYDINLTANFKERKHGEFIDNRDGNVYKTIQIGSQIWMAENLKTTKYNDGTVMLLIPDDDDWQNLNTAGYCWYNNDISNKDVFGALYNWYAVDTGDLCPIGWHVPTIAEWTKLANYLSEYGYRYDGSYAAKIDTDHYKRTNIAKSLASESGWNPGTIEGAVGNTDYLDYFNKSGFSALAAGNRFTIGTFVNNGFHGAWWSSTEESNAECWHNSLYTNSSFFSQSKSSLKNSGFSVRCLSDVDAPEVNTHTLNLNVSHEGSGDVFGAGNFELGAKFAITANPGFSYVFVNWTGDTEHIANPNALNTLLTMPDFGISLTANFEKIEYAEFTDSRDNQVYRTIEIGDQVWMAENLRYLPSVVGSGTGSRTAPYCYIYGYEGTTVEEAKALANYTTYGVLYNWSAAMDGVTSSKANPSGVQGVCPTGWHLPSDAEWTELTNFLGGSSIAGSKLKETGTTHWNSPINETTNETGFTALPGGRRSTNSIYHYLGDNGGWWSATDYEFSGSDARVWVMYHNNRVAGRSYANKGTAFSVRCVRD